MHFAMLFGFTAFLLPVYVWQLLQSTLCWPTSVTLCFVQGMVIIRAGIAALMHSSGLARQPCKTHVLERCISRNLH
jgi:hypothetical protein